MFQNVRQRPANCSPKLLPLAPPHTAGLYFPSFLAIRYVGPRACQQICWIQPPGDSKILLLVALTSFNIHWWRGLMGARQGELKEPRAARWKVGAWISKWLWEAKPPYFLHYTMEWRKSRLLCGQKKGAIISHKFLTRQVWWVITSQAYNFFCNGF